MQEQPLLFLRFVVIVHPHAHFLTKLWQVDRNLASDFTGNNSGATASVAFLHSLDVPSVPFFLSQKLSLTVAHCGSVTFRTRCLEDSTIYIEIRGLNQVISSPNNCQHSFSIRVLVASTNGGHVQTMTEEHHADARVESARLRRMMGASLVTDSFGESRCALVYNLLPAT